MRLRGDGSAAQASAADLAPNSMGFDPPLLGAPSDAISHSPINTLEVSGHSMTMCGSVSQLDATRERAAEVWRRKSSGSAGCSRPPSSPADWPLSRPTAGVERAATAHVLTVLRALQYCSQYPSRLLLSLLCDHPADRQTDAAADDSVCLSAAPPSVRHSSSPQPQHREESQANQKRLEDGRAQERRDW